MSTEHGHAENWRKWLAHLISTPCVGLELGTWKGESAEWFLQHIFNHPQAHFYCVDTFEGSVEHHLAGIDCSKNEQETRDRLVRFFSKAAIWNTTTVDGLYFAHNAKLEFDFIYVDASHDAQNVLRDAVMAFEVLKVGGTMILDDYLWKVLPEPVDCPKPAIDALLECYAKSIEIVSFGGWQVCIRKTK
jgi:predicted O-methyltransferase YrrM